MAGLEKAVLSCFRAGILAVDREGTVAYINPIGEKILGGTGIEVGDNIHARAGENSFFRILGEAISMNYLPTRVEVGLPGKDGDRQQIGFTLSELKEGEVRAGICAFFKDLTHVEMAEENENLTQRLLLLGQMAAGLAHEIRNPIASIGVHCSILRNHLSANEKLLSSVSMMVREIEKIEYIIGECLNFVRPAELGVQNIRVDELVGRILDRYGRLNPGIEFVLRKQEGADLGASADPSLLEQALGNIIGNAVEACEGNGRIEVTFGISRHFIDRVHMRRRIDPIVEEHSGKEEEFVRISIRDTGTGIPEEIQDKIFVPFFTTKKNGTGLGLPIAQKIIHAHGGVLDLQSGPGKGTDFILKIPVGLKGGG